MSHWSKVAPKCLVSLRENRDQEENVYSNGICDSERGPAGRSPGDYSEGPGALSFTHGECKGHTTE